MSTADESPPSLSPEDHALLTRLRSGSPEALAAVIVTLEGRFGEELRLFCRRMLGSQAAAEDLVQDVLLTCCRVDAQSLPQHSLRGWLYQVARRKCIDQRRRMREPDMPAARAARRAQESFDRAVDPLTTPSGKALKRDRAMRVLAALDQMDEELRDVILMQYFQELTRVEIAEAIGLSLAGAKARIQRAMHELRDRLQALDESGL